LQLIGKLLKNDLPVVVFVPEKTTINGKNRFSGRENHILLRFFGVLLPKLVAIIKK